MSVPLTPEEIYYIQEVMGPYVGPNAPDAPYNWWIPTLPMPDEHPPGGIGTYYHPSLGRPYYGSAADYQPGPGYDSFAEWQMAGGKTREQQLADTFNQQTLNSGGAQGPGVYVTNIPKGSINTNRILNDPIAAQEAYDAYRPGGAGEALLDDATLATMEKLGFRPSHVFGNPDFVTIRVTYANGVPTYDITRITQNAEGDWERQTEKADLLPPGMKVGINVEYKVTDAQVKAAIQADPSDLQPDVPGTQVYDPETGQTYDTRPPGMGGNWGLPNLTGGWDTDSLPKAEPAPPAPPAPPPSGVEDNLIIENGVGYLPEQHKIAFPEQYDENGNRLPAQTGVAPPEGDNRELQTLGAQIDPVDEIINLASSDDGGTADSFAQMIRQQQQKYGLGSYGGGYGSNPYRQQPGSYTGGTGHMVGVGF